MIQVLKSKFMARGPVSCHDLGDTGSQKLDFDILNEMFPDQVIEPGGVEEIPEHARLVYVLCRDDRAIVVGEGRKSRARVLFDDATRCTKGHIKSLMVRLHHLCAGPGARFSRFVITCADKPEARQREKELHRLFGGNSCQLPAEAMERVFSGLRPYSPVWMVLKMACASSFSGLDDLAKWRRQGILNDETWAEVSNRLQWEDRMLRRHPGCGRKTSVTKHQP